MHTSSATFSISFSRVFSTCVHTTAMVIAGKTARTRFHRCQTGPNLFGGRSRKSSLNESRVILLAACGCSARTAGGNQQEASSKQAMSARAGQHQLFWGSCMGLACFAAEPRGCQVRQKRMTK